MVGCFLGAAIVHQVIRTRKLPMEVIVRNPVIPILFVIVALGVSPPKYYETRYSYFMYPLALCGGLLSAVALREVLRRRFFKETCASDILMIALCGVPFFFSEDYNAAVLTQASSDSIAFRTGRYERLSRHWYERWDFKRPAELVNAEATAGSKIIVSRDVDTTGFYLDKEFVVYFPWEAHDFTAVSRDRGKRELWSNNRMISTTREIMDETQHAETIWLILYPKWNSLKIDPYAIWPGRVKNVEVFTPGRDGRIEVWRVELEKC
jgi:hypothetical protein